MKRLSFLLVGLLLAGADKPLVIENGITRQLPAATSLQLSAPTTANATVNLPHGTAPTSPTNGDCWTTTTGLSCFINSTAARLLGTNTGDQMITLTGDAIGSGTSSFAVTVGKINGTSLAGLATGILKNTTTTGVPSIAVAADFPTLNQSTTGSAATLTTGHTIAITGDLTYTSPSFDGSSNVTAAGTLATVNATTGTFGSATKSLTVTANGKGLITSIAEQTVTPAVGSVTGFGTGVATALGVNVGSAGAFVTFNGALGTPSSGTLTNATALPISGLTSSTSTALGVGTLELGHASDTTIARSGAGDITVEGNGVYRVGGTDVSVADGGTGRSTSTTAYGLIAAGTTATGAHQTLAAGATTEILVGGGTSALPVWTTATGSGAPVRATSPALVTPALGTPASGVATNLTGLPLTSGVTGTLPIANGGTNDTGTAWTAYTPTLTCNTGTLTSATGSGRYKQIGKTTFVRILIAITTNGTCAGFITVTMPVASVSSGNSNFQDILSGMNTSVGKLLSVNVLDNSSNANVTLYDSTYPGANSTNLVITGVYESAS